MHLQAQNNIYNADAVPGSTYCFARCSKNVWNYQALKRFFYFISQTQKEQAWRALYIFYSRFRKSSLILRCGSRRPPIVWPACAACLSSSRRLLMTFRSGSETFHRRSLKWFTADSGGAAWIIVSLEPCLVFSFAFCTWTCSRNVRVEHFHAHA